MSRQLEQSGEERAAKRNARIVKILDSGLSDALDVEGIELLGFAIRYDAWHCLMTIKADIGGVRSVCFVGSESIAGCILRAHADAGRGALKWRADRYHKSKG